MDIYTRELLLCLLLFCVLLGGSLCGVSRMKGGVWEVERGI